MLSVEAGRLISVSCLHFSMQRSQYKNDDYTRDTDSGDKGEFDRFGEGGYSSPPLGVAKDTNRLLKSQGL